MPQPLVYDQAAPRYCGVIASGADMRLIVSALGAAYRVQIRKGGKWRVLRSFGSGLIARPWCAVVGIDVPSAVMTAAVHLPDNPADCPSVPPRRRLRSASRSSPPSSKRPRPSELERLTLRDGRLAWPVARERGVKEATFRMRLLRGWSPEAATFYPVEPRGSRSCGPVWMQPKSREGN